MNEQLSAKEAICMLYDMYADDVYRYALFNLVDDSDASDVVQEVFFRAFRSWKTFRNDATPRTWLLTIARNHIYDVFRKRKKDRALLDHCGALHEIDECANRETLMDLEMLVRGVKEDYRQVFVLRHIDNVSIVEVARVLGWSEAKVRTTDFRAIAMLRKAYVQQQKEVRDQHELRTRNVGDI